jgi:WD40 repeat protein
VAWSWFRQSGVVSSRPPAGNANRWVATFFRSNMNIKKISLLILVFALFGCNSSKSESLPIFTSAPTNLFRPTEISLPTPTLAIQSAASQSELRVITTDNQVRIVGFIENVFSLTWSKDGKLLIIGPQDKNLYVYDLESKKVSISPIKDFPANNLSGLTAELHPTHDPDIVIANEHTKLTVWNAANGEKTQELLDFSSELHKQGIRFNISGVALSPDGKSLIAGYSKDFVNQKTFMVWDTSTWKLQRTFSGGNLGPDFTVVLSPDGKRFTTSGGSGIHEPSTWDFNTGNVLFSLGPQPWVRAIVYDPSGKYFAAGGTGGGNPVAQVVMIYDSITGKLSQKLDAVDFVINILAFSPDGTRLAAGGGRDRPGEVRIWDLIQP